MIRFTKIRNVRTPERGSEFSAGIDFFVPNDFTTKVVLPREDILIPSGIKLEIPEHTALLGVDKSGVASSSAAKYEVGLKDKSPQLCSSIIVGAKLIDADYRGEVHIHLINTGNKPIVIEPGMKVAQFMLVPVFYDRLVEVNEYELHTPVTNRSGGFGSTNK